VQIYRCGIAGGMPVEAYPTGAWYSYNDVTCTYGCQKTEFILRRQHIAGETHSHVWSWHPYLCSYHQRPALRSRYLYWLLTSYLNGQGGAGSQRSKEIHHEWKLPSRSLLRSGDGDGHGPVRVEFKTALHLKISNQNGPIGSIFDCVYSNASYAS
jgi:hypothetical protein